MVDLSGASLMDNSDAKTAAAFQTSFVVSSVIHLYVSLAYRVIKPYEVVSTDTRSG